jgi:hypothetical protein
MKTIIKIIIASFIIFMVFGIYKAATMSDSEQIAHSLKRINEGLFRIKTEAELETTYKEVDELQKKDTAGEFKDLFKEIYDHKQAIIERVESKTIDSNKEFAYDLAVKAITEKLKAPSTAKFQNRREVKTRYDEKEKMYTIEMYVDAQNVYGAMIRGKFRVQLFIHDGKWLLYGVEELN